MPKNTHDYLEVPTMQLIEADHFHALLDHLRTAAPDLVPACRWLACGPSMAPLILGRDAGRPSAAGLARLAAMIDGAQPPSPLPRSWRTRRSRRLTMWPAGWRGCWRA